VVTAIGFVTAVTGSDHSTGDTFFRVFPSKIRLVTTVTTVTTVTSKKIRLVRPRCDKWAKRVLISIFSHSLVFWR
jgi:hypothetical protein